MEFPAGVSPICPQSARRPRGHAVLLRHRIYVALTIVLPAVLATGCNFSCFDAFLEINEFRGAKLVVPASATAGDTITLDATGSKFEVDDGPCPDIVRFHAAFDGERASTEPLAVITAPRSQRPTRRGAACELVDGKVQIKVPGARTPGVRSLIVSVNMQAFTGSVRRPRPGEPVSSDKPPIFTTAVKGIRVTTPQDKVNTAPLPAAPAATPAPAPAPANQPPVARFFRPVEPALKGQVFQINATESTDADGTIVKYEWDLASDGTFEASTVSPVQPVQISALGTSNVTLRVTDDRGATATVTHPIDVVDPAVDTTVFPTYGDFQLVDGSADPVTEIPVNTDVSARVTDVPAGATLARLYADDATDFAAEMTPLSVGTFVGAVQFATPGFHTITIEWKDGGSKSAFVTKLIRVLPSSGAGATSASVRGSAAATKKTKGTKMVASLRASFVPVTFGRMSLVAKGVTAKGMIVRGSLKGKVRVAKSNRKRKVPAGVKVLRNGRFAGTFDGTLPSAGEDFGAPYGKGTLLVRDPKDRTTQLCLRVTQNSRTKTRFVILGATGKARGLRGSGEFPAILPDTPGKKKPSKTARITFTLSKGKAKKLSKSCRTLIKRQLAPKKQSSKKRKSS